MRAKDAYKLAYTVVMDKPSETLLSILALIQTSAQNGVFVIITDNQKSNAIPSLKDLYALEFLGYKVTQIGNLNAVNPSYMICWMRNT